MKPGGARPGSGAPEHLPAADRSCALNVMAVYQDVESRERVMEFRDRVTRSIGRNAFYLQLWSFRDLSEPEIFQEAVLAAVSADVVVASFRVAEKLHSRFCGWMESWVPRRCRRDGALIALVEATGPDGASLEQARKYLRGVAREARLEFLLREYTTAACPPDVLEPFGFVRPPSCDLKNKSVAK